MPARRDKKSRSSHFDKLKVIFVDKDANNTSKRVNLLGGFTVVIIVTDHAILR